MLSLAQAQTLLAPIVESPVQTIQHISNTNDVFKVLTERNGNFFVKFHTSPWYKDAADTAVVVQREASAHAQLKRKGIPLDYRVWTDLTRQTVGRSVLITSELPGTTVPTALKECPAERDAILAALAGFLRRLHTLSFPRAGYLETSGDPDLAFTLDPAGNDWCDSHACHKPENFRDLALRILDSKRELLPPALFATLGAYFDAIPALTAADYRPPRFVINNYHPFHVHVLRDRGGWRVTGLYDFEAASSGSPVIDRAGNELQLAPLLGGLSWREGFYAAYGGWPEFESFKVTLLAYLLIGLGKESSEEVPDPAWLVRALPGLIEAQDYEGFGWYPE